MFDRMRAERLAEKRKFAIAACATMIIASLLHIRNYYFNDQSSSISAVNMWASLGGMFAVFGLSIRGVKQYVASDIARGELERRQELAASRLLRP